MILSTPNLASLKNRFKLFFGKMPSNNALSHPTVEDHLFWHKSDWTLKHLCNFFKKAGFILDVKTSSGLFLKNIKILSGDFCPPELGEILIIRAKIN